MSSENLCSTDFGKLDSQNKRARSNYCVLCNVKAGNASTYLSHIAGRRHQSQLRNLATSCSKKVKISKQSKKNTSKGTTESGLPEKSSKKIKSYVEPNRSNKVDKEGSSVKNPGSSDGSNPKKSVSELKKNQEVSSDKEWSSYSQLVEAFRCEIPSGGSNNISCSSVEESRGSTNTNNQVEKSSSAPPLFTSSEMKTTHDFRFQPRGGILPYPHRYPSPSFPDFHRPVKGIRPGYWHGYPPPPNFHGRFQYPYGHSPNMYHPNPSHSTSAYRPPHTFKQVENAANLFIQNSRGSKKDRLEIEDSGQSHSSVGSKERRSAEKNKDSHNQIARSNSQSKTLSKANDSIGKCDSSSSTEPLLARLSSRQYPLRQGEKGEVEYQQNSRDSSRGVHCGKPRYRSRSPLHSQRRYSAERQKDSEALDSRHCSDSSHGSNNSRNRHKDPCNDTEGRRAKDSRNGKTQTRQTAESSTKTQSKDKASGQVPMGTSVSRKAVPELKPIDCAKAGSVPSKSSSPATPKSPTFSNVTMQRINARLQSFTKYGKMPTSGQIRNLAISASPTQEKMDGKLQAWSKKIESHHNLSAQDKELINRLVNYPCSRREQKKLEYCIREHARSRKKLTLPRFNLQLSGMEECKESPSVDDNVNSMVTEVVDCLPEDVLNSLINALNSDVDEYIAVSLPFGMDAKDAHMSTSSEDGSGVHSSGKICFNENVFITVDESEGNSSCDETADHLKQQFPSADRLISCHSKGNLGSSSAPNNQVQETVVDQASPVKKATEQLMHGSSLEVSESRNPKADKKETVSVEVNMKEEPVFPQGRNAEKDSSLVVSGYHKDVNSVTNNSGNLVKTLPNEKKFSVKKLKVKTELLDVLPDIEVIDISGAVPSSPSMPLFSSQSNSRTKFVWLPAPSKKESSHTPYSDVSPRITAQGVSGKFGSITTIDAGPPRFNKNTQSHCSSYMSADFTTSAVIKAEPQSINDPDGSIQTETFTLPTISSVTSIRNSELFSDISSLVTDCSVTQIKQEPASPSAGTTNSNENGGAVKSEVNCSKVSRTHSTELSSTGTSNSLDHELQLRNIAAAFPGIIHKVSSLSQKDDAECRKTPEVSSSTGALLDEAPQTASSVVPKNMLHSAISNREGTSSDLIRELLSNTSAEEKLVQQASEAERMIAQLTASLEEWKRKKYEIEHEQMKLRMKRQELLLLNAAKACIPYSNNSFPSSTENEPPKHHDGSSGDEEQMAFTQSEKSVSDASESSLSQMSNKVELLSSGNIMRREMSQYQHSYDKTHKSRGKKHLTDNDHSDSSTVFSSRQSAKHQNCNKSFLKDDHLSSSERNYQKKKCLEMNPQVVLQPLQLNNSLNGGTIVINNNDDIIILDNSPHRSEASTEMEADSSEDCCVISQEEDYSYDQEDVISPSTTKLSVNIETLAAHSGSITDLKVYDGYLYSCSSDGTAKRFSLEDPGNDNTSYEGHQKNVTSICLSPKKEVYTTCSDGYLRCFLADVGINIDRFEMKNSIMCSCSGGRALYLGLSTGEVIFFSFKHRKTINELKCASCSISRMATATQGAQRLLCVAANDGIVSLYDTSTGLLLRCLETRVQPPCFIQICDDSIYITTSAKSIVIHHLLSGKLVRMVNWAASATGLEIIDNYILTSSYDGLIRCHNMNQDMASHSIYYGAGNSMVVSMTAHKKWVFTGNRKGIIEAFKFDPSKQLACKYGRCRLKYGRECDVLHHVTIDHLPYVNMKARKCPWTGCAHEFTPRTTIEVPRWARDSTQEDPSIIVPSTTDEGQRFAPKNFSCNSGQAGSCERAC